MMYLAFALSIIAGVGLFLAGLFARRERKADERARTAYVRGFDACSRVRDREEVQERKLALLVISDDRVSSPRSPEPLQSGQDGAVDTMKFN